MIETVDWSKKQIVTSDNEKVLVFTDGTCSDNRFGGTIIQDFDSPHLVGTYIPDFLKWAYYPVNVKAEIIMPINNFRNVTFYINLIGKEKVIEYLDGQIDFYRLEENLSQEVFYSQIKSDIIKYLKIK